MPEYIELVLLLIVVAILAMLVAVLLQSYRSARRVEDVLRHMKDETLHQVAQANRELREELDGKFDRLRDSQTNMFDTNRVYTQKAMTTM